MLVTSPTRSTLAPTLGRGGLAPGGGRTSLTTVPQAQEVERILVPEAIRPRRRMFRPIIVLFMGRRYQGKTLALTATAYAQWRRYRSLGINMKVASNYWLDFADICSPYLVDELMHFPPWAHNLYVCIDEVSTAWLGRRAMSDVNRTASQLLTQIRKLNVEMGFTTQFPQVLDQQVTMQIDLFIRCQQFNGARAVDLEVWDYWGQWTGDDRRKMWPPWYEPPDWELTLWNTDAMWHRFRSGEVIAPIWSPSRDQVIDSQWDMLAEPSQPQEIPPPPPAPQPSSPEEALEQALASEPGAFSVMAKLDLAKRFFPDFNRRTFAEWLQEHGYTVSSEHGHMVAERAA